MSFFHVNISDIDAQMAHFARAIALPIRVFILRMIAENGNALTKQSFYSTAFKASTINKHLLELRSLGIVKVKTVKAQVTYYIDQSVYDQMAVNFSMFFQANTVPAKAPRQTELINDELTTPIPNDFGAFIKENRMDRNLSQATLAKKLEIDRALLSRVENGLKHFDELKLPLLAKAFQITEDEISNVFKSADKLNKQSIS